MSSTQKSILSFFKKSTLPNKTDVDNVSTPTIIDPIQSNLFQQPIVQKMSNEKAMDENLNAVTLNTSNTRVVKAKKRRKVIESEEEFINHSDNSLLDFECNSNIKSISLPRLSARQKKSNTRTSREQTTIRINTETNNNSIPNEPPPRHTRIPRRSIQNQRSVTTPLDENSDSSSESPPLFRARRRTMPLETRRSSFNSNRSTDSTIVDGAAPTRRAAKSVCDNFERETFLTEEEDNLGYKLPISQLLLLNRNLENMHHSACESSSVSCSVKRSLTAGLLHTSSHLAYTGVYGHSGRDLDVFQSYKTHGTYLKMGPTAGAMDRNRFGLFGPVDGRCFIPLVRFDTYSIAVDEAQLQDGRMRFVRCGEKGNFMLGNLRRRMTLDELHASGWSRRWTNDQLGDHISSCLTGSSSWISDAQFIPNGILSLSTSDDSILGYSVKQIESRAIERAATFAEVQRLSRISTGQQNENSDNNDDDEQNGLYAHGLKPAPPEIEPSLFKLKSANHGGLYSFHALSSQPGSTLFATSGKDGIVRTFAMRESEMYQKPLTETIEFESHKGTAKSVKWSPHINGLLASAGNDKSIALYDARNSLKLSLLSKMDFEKYIGIGRDSMNEASSTLVRRWIDVSKQCINRAEWSPLHGFSLLCTGNDQIPRIIDIRRSDRPVFTLNSHFGSNSKKVSFPPNAVFIRNGLQVLTYDLSSQRLAVYSALSGELVSSAVVQRKVRHITGVHDASRLRAGDDGSRGVRTKNTKAGEVANHKSSYMASLAFMPSDAFDEIGVQASSSRLVLHEGMHVDFDGFVTDYLPGSSSIINSSLGVRSTSSPLLTLFASQEVLTFENVRSSAKLGLERKEAFHSLYAFDDSDSSDHDNDFILPIDCETVALADCGVPCRLVEIVM